MVNNVKLHPVWGSMQSTAIVQTIKSVQLNARYKRCCCFYWKRTASLETIVLLETVVLLNLILFFCLVLQLNDAVLLLCAE